MNGTDNEQFVATTVYDTDTKFRTSLARFSVIIGKAGRKNIPRVAI